MSLVLSNTIELPEVPVTGVSAYGGKGTDMEVFPRLWERFQSLFGDPADNVGVVQVYHDYESDETGQYVITIGLITGQDDAYIDFVLPAATYSVFECDDGPPEEVVPKAWAEIWEMSDEELGGKRTFTGDFDLVSVDPVLIFVAVE